MTSRQAAGAGGRAASGGQAPSQYRSDAGPGRRGPRSWATRRAGGPAARASGRRCPRALGADRLATAAAVVAAPVVFDPRRSALSGGRFCFRRWFGPAGGGLPFPISIPFAPVQSAVFKGPVQVFAWANNNNKFKFKFKSKFAARQRRPHNWRAGGERKFLMKSFHRPSWARFAAKGEFI